MNQNRKKPMPLRCFCERVRNEQKIKELLEAAEKGKKSRDSRAGGALLMR